MNPNSEDPSGAITLRIEPATQRDKIKSWISVACISALVVALLIVAWRMLTDNAIHPSTDSNHIHMLATPAAQQPSFFQNLAETYMPRRMCMAYEKSVIWLHLVSDLLIAIAYYSIPLALIVFVRRRKDLVFKWAFWLFAAFILACGTTHIVAAIDLWIPFYKLDGILKLATALLSVVTAAALWPLIPKALALPSHQDLEQAVQKRTVDLSNSNQALRESDQKFRLIANSIPQLAWMAHGDGNIFWFNQRWLDYTGKTLSDMEGWGWQSVHDPAHLPKVVSSWKAALASGTPWEHTFPLRRHDGQTRRHLSRANPLRNADGNVVLWFGTNTDIEDQLQTAQLLDLTQQQLEMSCDAAELGTFHCPMPLGHVEWNLKCKEHFWLDADASVSIDLFYALLHPEDRDRTRRELENALSEKRPYDVEYRTVAPDGRHRWIRAKGRAYYDADGSPNRFDGITIDISGQKQAESERETLLEAERQARSEAERLSQMKDEFLATLSHELRTPLNAILGWSQLLRRGPELGQEASNGLAVIERNARAQAQLIEDLLDLSRVISGKLRIDVQRIELPDIIQLAVDSIRPAADAKEIRVVTVLDHHLSPVRGDPARLQQVIWNLLSNAVKFTPKGGKVQVALERVNSHVEITVTDTGGGISPEFLPHVFERFRQADSSTTRAFGGLGIGLAIVKSIVEAHGGHVRVRSDGKDRGAAFSIELPLIALHSNEADIPREHPRSINEDSRESICFDQLLADVTVLVVDDEKDARDLVCRVIEGCHGHVLAASNAKEAMEMVRQHRPTVILSDIGMPQTDGYELIRQIRAIPADQGGDTPAAALTAFARSEDRRRALVAGYQAHIAKPVEAAELITVVASLAGKMRRAS